MEKEKKSDASYQMDEKMTQKPSTVKYFYFDKDGRQLSEETVRQLKINVKGNVVLASGLADSHLDGTYSENDFQKLASQQAATTKGEHGKQKTSVPNFQASHNGQIYLVTPDGGLRPAVKSSEANAEPENPEKKQSTNIEYRNRGTNHINRNGKVKRPMNAFMLWAREFRGKLAEQMPNASNAEISVGLGQVWANLPTLEKQHFYLEAERVKNQHRRDFPGWVYQPNITKRQNQKDTQHTRMWQRFVSKEAETKVKDKATPQLNQSSSEVSCTSDSTEVEDPKKSSSSSSQKGTSKVSEGSEVTDKGRKPQKNGLTLDQRKQQQESKIDAQTIQSTVKQICVSSNSQPRVYSQPIPSFKEFKMEVMSSEKPKRNASYGQSESQSFSGDRADKAPVKSTQPPNSANSSQLTYRPPPVAMVTQVHHSTAYNRGPIPTPAVQVSKLGRPNTNVLKYDYRPQSKATPFIPMSRPLVSSAVVVSSSGQVRQPFISFETPRAQNQTMANQFVPQQMNTAPHQTTSPQHHAIVNSDHSPSSDDLQQPIAIPTLPNLNDKADPLWPFPFPPVQQGPQTHLLYEGSVSETINPKTILSDPYAPFYFDNYVNQVRPSELQVDINGWQQYLSDDHTRVRDNQPPSYPHRVKQCPSDLEICPSPASHTLSRNQAQQSSSGAELTSSISTGSMTSSSNAGAYQKLNMNMIQQGESSTSLTASTSQENMHQQGSVNAWYVNPEKQNSMIQHVEGDNQQEEEGNVIHITPVQTPSGHHIGTMIQNFGSNEISINSAHYGNENLYHCVPQFSSSGGRNQGKGVEFGSAMSSAFNAIDGEIDSYENTSEKYPIPGCNETVTCSMLPQGEAQQICLQPSGSTESFQTISKYQDENNRPIKKRSYKIIEGLLENEVWMAQHKPRQTMSATVQSLSDLDDGKETVGSKSDDKLLRKEGKINSQDAQNLDQVLSGEDNGEESVTNLPQAVEGDKMLEVERNTIVDGAGITGVKGSDMAENGNVIDEGHMTEEDASNLKGDGRCNMIEDEESMMGSHNNKLPDDDAIPECIENTQEKTTSNAGSVAAREFAPFKRMERKHDEELTGEIPEALNSRDVLEEEYSPDKTEQENNQTLINPKQLLCNSETTNINEVKDLNSEIPMVKTEPEIYEGIEADIEIKTEPLDEDHTESSMLRETHEETDGNAEDATNDAESSELSQLEIVIDNAEMMSPSNCEEQYHVSNDKEISGSETQNPLLTCKISKNQMSEILEDESSSDLDTIKTRESGTKSERIFKSIQLVEKNRSNVVDTMKKSHCQNTQYPDYSSSMESGDASASVERMALESDVPLPSLIRTRNKRRRPLQESPVRTSKRQRN
uniref:Uncharacterized protein LOC111134191 isoform X2 n=1 Tax=Crassostrea virginica TaxID=6565 RepID=A0A8B8EGB6_CRAVI|nr:uncharacterized protein LOC111134191 isoform X2 [Crassostrea virginica]